MNLSNGKWALAALILAALLASAPAGAAPVSSVAAVALYKGPDRQARLEAGARGEGALLLYTSMDLEESQPIIEAFQRKYPFIRGEVYRATGEDVAQKIITEYRGGKYIADIFEGTGIDVAKMIKEGFAQAYYTPRAGAFPRQAKDPKGFWIASRYNILVAAWNTNLVSDADSPRTYEDLITPKWRGKIGIEATDQVWLGTLMELWGEAKGMEFFRTLGNQQLQIRSGHTLLANLIVAGEIPMSPTIYNHRVQLLKGRNAPIDWRPLQPAVAIPHVISLPKNAPHPNAALLFIDFLLSREGQQELVKLGRIPSYPLINANPPYLNQGFAYKVINPETFLEKFARYDAIWQDLIIRRR
ncbi:MAG TPA: extracellular solute-binding protein [bacterium]|jgi:iron(III) transport system substrate-binding protein